MKTGWAISINDAVNFRIALAFAIFGRRLDPPVFETAAEARNVDRATEHPRFHVIGAFDVHEPLQMPTIGRLHLAAGCPRCTNHPRVLFDPLVRRNHSQHRHHVQNKRMVRLRRRFRSLRVSDEIGGYVVLARLERRTGRGNHALHREGWRRARYLRQRGDQQKGDSGYLQHFTFPQGIEHAFE